MEARSKRMCISYFKCVLSVIPDREPLQNNWRSVHSSPILSLHRSLRSLLRFQFCSRHAQLNYQKHQSARVFYSRLSWRKRCFSGISSRDCWPSTHWEDTCSWPIATYPPKELVTSSSWDSMTMRRWLRVTSSRLLPATNGTVLDQWKGKNLSSLSHELTT